MHAHLAAKGGRGSAAKRIVPGICLETVGKPQPILKLMASTCFHGITEAGLKKLIDHLGFELPSKPSLFTKLSTLLRGILGCSDADLIQLLEMRLDKSQEEFMQLCEMDDVADLCDTKEDGKILQDEVERTKAGLEAQASYCQDLRSLVKAVRSKASKGKSARGSSSSSKAPVAEASRRIPNQLPEDEVFDEALAQSLLPPTYAIYKDFFNNRWIVHYKGAGTWNVSRSWSLHGSRAAVLLVCQAAWKRHQALTGEECPCKGLMEALCT